MYKRLPSSLLSRRQFLIQSPAAACVAGAALSSRPTDGAPLAPGQNPFAYDLERWRKTDPALIQYRPDGRWESPHELPQRIAIGPGDRVYIAAGRFVSVHDQQGAILSEIALQSQARCVAVTPEGDTLVGLQDHVEVFDPQGQRRASWASPNSKTWLTGLAVAGPHVFLADAGNRVVLRCDLSGKVLGKIGEKDKTRDIPGFIVPSPFFDVKMHPDGLLRVTNPGRHRVEAYTTDGALESAFGKASAAIEGFCGCCNPVSLAFLSDGRIVTCEKGLPRVKVFGTDGRLESVVAGAESFPENGQAVVRSSASEKIYGGLDAAVDSRGQIYILDLVKADIRVMVRKPALPPAAADPARTGA